METGPTAQLIRGVLDRRLDAAIATLPAPSNDLVVTSLGWQGMAAALPMTDARAFEPTLRLDGLAPARLVTMRRAINPAFHDATLAACRSAGVAPAMFEVSAPSVESVLLAVAAGVGPAILPISVAERHAMPGVRLVPLDARWIRDRVGGAHASRRGQPCDRRLRARRGAFLGIATP